MSLRIVTKKALVRTLGALIYMLSGAFIFQTIEKGKQTDSSNRTDSDVLTKISMKLNITAEKAEMVLSEVQKALTMTPGCHLPVEWDYRNSLIFTFSVVTTIGWGHLVPRSAMGQIICIFYAVFGIPLFAALMKSWGETIQFAIEHTVETIEQRIFSILRPQNMHMKCFVVTVILMILTVLSGGLFFSETKGWSYLEGVYYYFISISTIGFGDLTYIEGEDQRKDNVLISTLMTSHMFFGLAVTSSVVVAMCRIFSIARSRTLFVSIRDQRLQKSTSKYSVKGKPEIDTDLNNCDQ